MIIQNNDYSVPARNGIKIQVPVLDFGVLDFAKARTIYDIGYKTGLEMVDSIKRRVSAGCVSSGGQRPQGAFRLGHRRWDSIPWW